MSLNLGCCAVLRRPNALVDLHQLEPSRLASDLFPGRSLAIRCCSPCRQHRVSDQPCAIHTRVHFMVPSYLPVISAEEAYHRPCPLCCQDRHSYDRVSQPTRYTDRTSATTVNALRNCQCRVCQTGVSQHQLSAIELMTLLTTTVHHSQLIILKWIPISN